MLDSSRVLLVDLGGVLFDFNHRRRLLQLERCLRLPAGRIDALLWHSGFSRECDTGAYPDSGAVRAQIRRITGYEGSDSVLDTAWCAAYRPNHVVIGLLRRSSAELELGILTNNGPLEEDVLFRLYPYVFDIFRVRLFSHRLRARKPDAAVFRHVIEKLDVPPNRIYFFDDSTENVMAARRSGWQAIQYRSSIDFAKQLTERVALPEDIALPRTDN